MKNLKAFLALQALITIGAVSSLAAQTASQPSSDFSPTPPRRVEALFRDPSGTKVVTFRLLPGQALKLYDPYYDFVKVEAVFPVAVHMGQCNTEQTSEFECRGIPENSYIIVYDTRAGTSPDFSPPNRLKFTAVHHRPAN
jgi:hypothetical protein